MARVGLKMSVAGLFTAGEVVSFWTAIRQAIVDAGFDIIENTASAIEFIKAGYSPDHNADDVPHWRMELNEQALTWISALAVSGAAASPERRQSSAVQCLKSGEFYGVSAGAHDVWFAADGLDGWWWIATSGENDSFGQFAAASACRRYATDQTTGEHPRYCLVDRSAYLYFPWSRNFSGTRLSQPYTESWSPLGAFGNGMPKRHPESTLPRMVAPIWPRIETASYSFAVVGELTHVMARTDGYNVEEAPLPGWIAMKTGQNTGAFCLPAPASFDIVSAA